MSNRGTNPFAHLAGAGRNVLSTKELQRVVANYKLTPATLKQELDPSWIPAPFLQMLSNKVAAGVRKGGLRLIVSLPFRHGKSEFLSIATPTWIMEEFPTKRTIISTYGADLSAQFGRKVRDTIIANPDKLNTRINRKASKVAYFENMSGGSVSSVGTGGAITGKGADVFIIDDYFKGPEEAFSKANRDNLWDWFRSVALTRLEPGASMIILATRWHSDGLIGRIVKEYGDEWEYISIPGIATEDNDILGRMKGDPLFPERYDRQRLLKFKDELGSAFFEALVQQNPLDEHTKFTDKSWLQTTVALPPEQQLSFLRIWDLASTEGGGDYTTGILLALDRKTKNVFVVDVKRERLTPHAVELLVLRTAEEDGDNVDILIEQDPGQAGVSQLDHYKKEVLPDYKVDGILATKKKVVKAQAFLAAAEAKRVFLYAGPENNFGDWHEDYKNEFDTFPHGVNDDQIDCSAVGFNWLESKRPKRVAWGRGKHTKYGTKQTYHQTISNVDKSARTKSKLTFGRRR